MNRNIFACIAMPCDSDNEKKTPYAQQTMPNEIPQLKTLNAAGSENSIWCLKLGKKLNYPTLSRVSPRQAK